tara:strand:+ start:26483 stop:26758 length:276 start_codon:yes stop_codon:yes gene_type:complete
MNSNELTYMKARQAGYTGRSMKQAMDNMVLKSRGSGPKNIWSHGDYFRASIIEDMNLKFISVLLVNKNVESSINNELMHLQHEALENSSNT